MVLFDKPGVENTDDALRIAIDEAGVQAAAATLLIIADGAPLLEPDPEEINLIFDRPFLFFVSYNDLPLFVGVVADPNAS